MRTTYPWILLLLLAGCAGRLEKAVRLEAAQATSCPAESVTVTRLPDGSPFRGDYTAEGCGATAKYAASCFLQCQAQSEQQRAEAEAEAEAQRAAQAEAREEQRAREPAGSSPPASSGPARVSGRLINLCNQKVYLWRGREHNGSGRSDSLGANTTISLQGNAGDKLWIVDSHNSSRKSLDGFTLDPAVKDLFIDKSCARFTTKR